MKNLIILVFIFIASSVNSQELKVTYNNRILIDSTRLENALGNEKNELITAAEGEDYELVLSNGNSLYGPKVFKKDKTYESSSRSGNNISITYNYYEIIFLNKKRMEIVSSIKSGGETFLIKENLEPIDWQIMQETKKIDSYNVKRAEAVVGGSNIIVWFTDEIPISAGPSYFTGLPGLILQAQFGKRLITAKKIEPLTGNLTLAPPTEGMKYTREEYDQLIDAKNNVKEGTITNGSTTTTVTRN
jgi:GLPGLI family protein